MVKSTRPIPNHNIPHSKLNFVANNVVIKNINIEINSNADFIVILIGDDEIGFDEDLITKGNGLLNMEKRIEEIGGSIHFGTNENGGTQIQVQIKK